MDLETPATPNVSRRRVIQVEGSGATGHHQITNALLNQTDCDRSQRIFNQLAGALDAGRAVARALAERHGKSFAWPFSPRLTPEGVILALHDTIPRT